MKTIAAGALLAGAAGISLTAYGGSTQAAAPQPPKASAAAAEDSELLSRRARDIAITGGNMNKLTTGFAICGIAAAAGLSLAACGTSSSSSSSSGPVTGTETFSGTEHLTAAETASSTYSPTVPLTASGLFSDTGSIYLGGGNSAGPGTIVLKNGDIKVQHAKTNPNLQPKPIGTGCNYAVTEAVGYTVTGGTGSYSNVTGGKGVATVIFGFTLPKLSNGSCNTSSSATPTAGYATFHAVGSLTRSS